MSSVKSENCRSSTEKSVPSETADSPRASASGSSAWTCCEPSGVRPGDAEREHEHDAEAVRATLEQQLEGDVAAGHDELA